MKIHKGIKKKKLKSHWIYGFLLNILSHFKGFFKHIYNSQQYHVVWVDHNALDCCADMVSKP